jgi:Protein of unknown function (DUF2591)
MKLRTSELTDAALDWAVTKAEGFDHEVTSSEWGMWGWATDWAQGGPIIERERISVMLSFRDSYAEGANAKPSGWCARKYQYGVLNEPLSHGDTPLIAAMRCYVASKLGDEVDVPEELKC